MRRLALIVSFLTLAQISAQDVPTFRSEVNLVKVDVQVTKPSGETINDLTQNDFVVVDEGQPQNIAFFAREEVPVEVLLVLDVSASMTRSLGELSRKSSVALGQLRPIDRVGLLLFAQRYQLAEPFTSDFARIRTRIIESIYKQTLGRGTRLNEALVEAARYAGSQPDKSRRSIIIVTDNGGEPDSQSNADVVRELLAANVVLNAILVRDPTEPKPETPKRSFFTTSKPELVGVQLFADKTGGEAILSEDASADFHKLVGSTRTRYALQYPAPPSEASGFRHIRIQLSDAASVRYPNAVIRAREGYEVKH